MVSLFFLCRSVRDLRRVDVEVVHDQVDGSACGIAESEFEDHCGELEAGTVRRGECEVASGRRLHRAENVGCVVAFVTRPSAR